MKATMVCILAVSLGLTSCATPQSGESTRTETPTVGPAETIPRIGLFDSAKRIEMFLTSEAKQDYSDKYLHSISYHYSAGHPRKGSCWLYRFAFRQPRMGGEISIYHFMDGQIIEFYHGP